MLLSTLSIFSTVSVNAQVTGPRRGGTDVYSEPFDPPYLNPAIDSGLTVHSASDLAYNSLVETDMNFAIRPGLAEKWDISSNGTIFTFHLVKNATWHDGQRFTSADVKFTFEKILVPYNPAGKPNFGGISSITTPDDYTVVFNLSKPSPSFLLFVGSTYNAPIMPKHIWQNSTDNLNAIRNNTATNHPIGTGAFMFKEWGKGDHITYVRNPNYWRADKPYIDSFIFKVIPDEQTQVQALLKCEINRMWIWLSPQSFLQLEGKPGLTSYRESPGAAGLFLVTMLYFNLDNPILKNLQVRQAIAYAINRSEISRLATQGLQGPAVGPVHKSTAWAYDTNLQPTYPTDITKANALLDQAGYPRAANGTRFTMRINDYQTYFGNIIDVIKDQLSKVGIQINHETFAPAVAQERLWFDRNFDMGVRIYLAGPDPSIALQATFAASSVGAGTNTNAEDYKSTQADTLLTQAQTELDSAKRRQEMLQWQSIIMTDLPGYPLLQPILPEALSNQWHAWPANPWGSGSMSLENEWWEGGTPITSTTQTTTTGVTPGTGGLDLYTLSIVAAAAIVVVLVGIVVVRRGRKGPSGP